MRIAFTRVQCAGKKHSSTLLPVGGVIPTKITLEDEYISCLFSIDSIDTRIHTLHPPSNIFSRNPIPQSGDIRRAAQRGSLRIQCKSHGLEWIDEWKRRGETSSANDQYRSYFHKQELCEQARLSPDCQPSHRKKTAACSWPCGRTSSLWLRSSES
jgi:hypothetical protein